MDNKQASRIVGGNPANGRKPGDFYPTPPDVTFALLDFLRLPKNTVIWEPAAGDGDMAEAIRARGYTCIATDINTGTDFLTATPPENAGFIITNPPFSNAEMFIGHAAYLRLPFAFLLKSQYWHAATRLRLFWEITPTYILPLMWRPDFNFKSGKSGSPVMDVMWCVWLPLHFGTASAYIPLQRPRPEDRRSICG